MRTTLIGLIACEPARCGNRCNAGGAGRRGRGASEKATFAGGCFWCMEPPFDELPGVISTTSGYTGGHTKNPTYEEVSAGGTGHAEAVEVVYDPAKISYAQLLDVFWKNIDPITPNRQFCDVGITVSVGRSSITMRNRSGSQKHRRGRSRARAASKADRHGDRCRPRPFYRAEEYHQDYYKKNPIRFNYYKFRCGRARRLAELWGSK